MELVIIEKDTPEWDFIWSWLENHPINAGLEEPRTALNEGEAWQYMGSFRNKDKVVSEFRHRNHPETQSVYRASVSHDTFNPDSIAKEIKIT